MSVLGIADVEVYTWEGEAKAHKDVPCYIAGNHVMFLTCYVEDEREDEIVSISLENCTVYWGEITVPPSSQLEDFVLMAAKRSNKSTPKEASQ